MRKNAVKEKLRRDEVAVGLLMATADVNVVGVAAAAGYDYVMTDLEHMPVSLRELEAIVRAADAAGIVPTTRVAGSTKADILSVLETGVRGIMVPAVESAAEARRVVDAARYAPVGRRGVYYLGYNSAYAGLSPQQHFASANEEVFLILQIETRAGLENLDAIAAVPGFDCLLVGPGDLTASLGVPWEFGHPEVWAAVHRTFAAAAARNLAPGIMPLSVAYARECVDAGARLLLWGPDLALLQRAAQEDAAALAEAIRWRPVDRTES